MGLLTQRRIDAYTSGRSTYRDSPSFRQRRDQLQWYRAEWEDGQELAQLLGVTLPEWADYRDARFRTAKSGQYRRLSNDLNRIRQGS